MIPRPPEHLRYLELGLPEYQQFELDRLKKDLELIEKGEKPSLFDCDYMEFQASVNSLEVEQQITPMQAWYFRTYYLGLDLPMPVQEDVLPE